MPKPTSKAVSASKLDTFDRAFITVLHSLQKIGFCKNVAQIEDFLQIPKRTLYQVIDGKRSLPKLHRHKVLAFFAENYKVNPKIFTNTTQPVFVAEPPTLKEVDEPYLKADGAERWTMGDAMELERLRKEVADKNDTIKELRKELKYWRDLGQSLLQSPKGAAGSRADSRTKGRTKKG